MSADISQEILSVPELAALLHCSTYTVVERARKGDLPGVKFGEGWVFPRQALLQYVNEVALEEARTRRRRPKYEPNIGAAPTDRRRRPPPDLPPTKNFPGTGRYAL